MINLSDSWWTYIIWTYNNIDINLALKEEILKVLSVPAWMLRNDYFCEILLEWSILAKRPRSNRVIVRSNLQIVFVDVNFEPILMVRYRIGKSNQACVLFVVDVEGYSISPSVGSLIISSQVDKKMALSSLNKQIKW